MLDFETMPEIPFTMEQILAQIQTNNAQLFAKKLMEALPEIGAHDDDRTVLVASIWEKGQTNVG